MVTRTEGYRLSRGKEEAGLAMAEDFLRSQGLPVERIEDPEDNYRYGDLLCNGRFTVECKRQPIDPDRYAQNFVEVFELTTNERHAGGFRRLSDLLDISPATLAAVKVKRWGEKDTLGWLKFVSVSLAESATHIVYVNPDKGWLAGYTKDDLLQKVRSAVLSDGFVRGAGDSNEDTHAVFVNYPDRRWRLTDGEWLEGGKG